MRVVFAKAAERDLEEIADRISRDDPRFADAFVDELIEAARGLGDFPERYPLLAGREAAGIRRRLHKNHLIFYAVGPDRITIVRVVHASRDYERELFPTE